MKLKIQRHGQILSLVQKYQFMTVDDLAARLEVTPQTIRRDIQELSESGRLKRYHGGASSNGSLSMPTCYKFRGIIIRPNMAPIKMKKMPLPG